MGSARSCRKEGYSFQVSQQSPIASLAIYEQEQQFISLNQAIVTFHWKEVGRRETICEPKPGIGCQRRREFWHRRLELCFLTSKARQELAWHNSLVFTQGEGSRCVCPRKEQAEDIVSIIALELVYTGLIGPFHRILPAVTRSGESHRRRVHNQVESKFFSSHVQQPSHHQLISAALSWMWPFRTSHVYRYEDLPARCGRERRAQGRTTSRRFARMQAIPTGRRKFAATNTANKNEGSEKEGATATIIVVTTVSARYMPSHRDSSAGHRYPPE